MGLKGIAAHRRKPLGSKVGAAALGGNLGEVERLAGHESRAGHGDGLGQSHLCKASERQG